MKRLTSILAISVIAVMSAGAARADIASTTYVDNKVSPVSDQANTNAGEIEKLQSGKQDKSAMVDSTSENLGESNDTNYPTVAAVWSITTSALGGQVNNKLDKKFTGEANKNKAVITDDNGAITTGTISSAMITDGAVTSEKILNGTIADADIADNAAIAQSKISGLTTSIADAKSAGTAAASALNTYKTSNDAALGKVKKTADDTAAAVNNETTGLAATKKIADANAEKLKTVATSATVTELTTRVGTAETNIGNLQSGKQDKLVSSGANANISGSNGVSVTVGTDGKIAVSGNQSAIDKAIAGKLGKNENAVSATKATQDGDGNTITATYATKTELGTKQDKLGYTAENAANKVTAISATSTDTQYPSAKAVYSELAKKQNNITIDSELSSTSTNPVQNKVVNDALTKKQATLTPAQLNAANSGITSTKVTTYDGYGAKITTAQNTANTAKTTAEAAIAAPAAATTSTDGVYTLTMKVVNGTKTYAWEQIGR